MEYSSAMASSYLVRLVMAITTTEYTSVVLAATVVMSTDSVFVARYQEAPG